MKDQKTSHEKWEESEITVLPPKEEKEQEAEDDEDKK